jgi:hypothetical protein
MKSAVLVAGLVGSLLLFLGCDLEHVETGPLVTEPVNIDSGGADRANIELNMGAGQLKVSGGGDKLLSGSLDYNVPGWKPIITSNVNGVHATVTIRQPDQHGGLGDAKNNWDLQVSNKTLLDLNVNCGAGQSQLDLGNVMLRALQVHYGAGQLDLDLTGKPTHDYEVNIEGGVGQANVHLPQDVGIWASAHGGIGSIKVTGLQKDGDHWENDLYNKAKVNVRIQVSGGIGEIRLIG